MAVDVSLMSGKTVSVQAALGSSVQILKRTAQVALGVNRGQLLDSSGSILHEQSTLTKLKLQSGAPLTLYVRKVQICGVKFMKPCFNPFLQRSWVMGPL